MSQLAGRTALITGANRGIGAGVARAFAAEGADIAITYPNADASQEAKQLCADIESQGRKALALEADAADAVATDSAVAETIRSLGRIDILVNNASIAHAAPVEDIDVDMWDRVVAVHLRGTFLACKYVLPHM